MVLVDGVVRSVCAKVEQPGFLDAKVVICNKFVRIQVEMSTGGIWRYNFVKLKED